MSGMEKETKGVRTKRQIYQCAMDLFREKGYDQVSVEEIVRTAGTAKGTFYIYFHSKADIILEMLRQYDDYYDHVMLSMDPKTPVDRRMEEIVRAACRFTQEVIGLDLIRVLYTKQLGAGKAHKRLLNEDRALFGILAQLIREGQAEGVYRPEYSAEDVTKVDASRCIACGRCVVVCPVGGRRFGGEAYAAASAHFVAAFSARREPEWFVATLK